ncbi:MAG: hypothetical protein GEV05_30935 [Betaproteobacteria bacterium]|nr:hypothetical protein [Betaproteobacteria bacterium]
MRYSVSQNRTSVKPVALTKLTRSASVMVRPKLRKIWPGAKPPIGGIVGQLGRHNAVRLIIDRVKGVVAVVEAATDASRSGATMAVK